MAVTDDPVIQAFLDMLDREHVDASSLDGQEMHVADTPCQSKMPIARDIYVDACFVELARSGSIVSAFGGLMYEMLISRPDIAAAVGAFPAGLISHSMIDHGIRHGGVLHVTFREPEAARQACTNPAPFIDGRRTNCNLAVLGAHRYRPASPLFQGPRYLPLVGDLSGQAIVGGAPQFGQHLPFPYHQGGYPYHSPLHGYPAYSPEYYASPSIYNPYVTQPQQLSGAVYPQHVPLSPTFQPVLPHHMQQQSPGQQEQHGGLVAMPLPLNLPHYFMPPPFMRSPGHVSLSAGQGPSTPRLVLQAPPFTPAGGGSDQQSSS
ncbi:hypothetical protein L7F22_043023 [Adiantum nelumboides]|nr:hypothetical protein [Adiantum nelumboides]